MNQAQLLLFSPFIMAKASKTTYHFCLPIRPPTSCPGIIIQVSAVDANHNMTTLEAHGGGTMTRKRIAIGGWAIIQTTHNNSIGNFSTQRLHIKEQHARLGHPIAE